VEALHDQIKESVAFSKNQSRKKKDRRKFKKY
jgi:hypothetical protein